MTLVDQLRGAVREDGRTLLEISRLAKIHHVGLSHFLSGRRVMSPAAHERLAAVLGYQIMLVRVPTAAPEPTRKKAPRDPKKP